MKFGNNFLMSFHLINFQSLAKDGNFESFGEENCRFDLWSREILLKELPELTLNLRS